jgi:hypothetical protein
MGQSILNDRRNEPIAFIEIDFHKTSLSFGPKQSQKSPRSVFGFPNPELLTPNYELDSAISFAIWTAFFAAAPE